MSDGLDLRPRKLPSQARSSATVDAILEATMQLVRREGLGNVTTTRVSNRAGVSVGSFYQYFPHKEALLFAAVQRHMQALAVGLEDLCRRSCGTALDAIADDLARGYLDLKIARARDRQSFYDAANDLGMDAVRAAVSRRIDLAVARLLASAADARFDDAEATASALMGAMRGPARAALDRSQDPAVLNPLRRELALLAGRSLAPFARRPHPRR